MGNPYPVALRDTSDVERFSGEATFTDPANQPGNGGSQPLAKTLTAAEITARWDGGAFYAAIEWAEFDADTFALLVAETVTTLDGDLTFAGLYAYDSGATTADVLNNGELIATAVAPSVHTYSTLLTAGNVVSAGTILVEALLAGKAAYIVYQGGTTPPTTGTATIRALRLT